MRERELVAETLIIVFQMYVLWGRRLKRLNKRLKQWIVNEKENEEMEMYEDLLDVRTLVLHALELYKRLMRQRFVRFTDEHELYERMETAVKAFNAFVIYYSTPPDSSDDVPFSLLQA